jgi:formylglycine-generating enzyme
MNKCFRLTQGFSLLLCVLLIASACRRNKYPSAENPGRQSTATGMVFNEDDGFQVQDFRGQPAGPNLVFIEGGRFVMGSSEEDIMNSRDNLERTISIQSFFMDETEIANIHWLEYLYYVQRDSSEEFYQSALPDTTVWASELAFNDSYVDHYLRYPGFRYFPVVGVSWSQAVDYCTWRTNVVNHKLAEDAGIEVPQDGGRIPIETGAVLPNYRLPSEAEWEYAAKALIGTQYLDENQTHGRLYPWDGHALRNPYGKQMGTFLANFKRGRGDYAGIAGRLNDAALITTHVYDFPPNDFGLYNMAGNVNEWVYDVYRPLSFQDFDDLNPIRRDGFLDVYKGGSWKDVAYWLSPGTRRYLEQDSATATIGFRCAMINAGTNR